MNDKVIYGATIASAAGSALSAGVFFAFSTLVMPSLNRISAAQAVPSMQSINKLAPASLFGATLFGTAITSAFLGITLITKWQQPGRSYLLAGVVLYLVGGILVTAIFNVPKNDALAVLDPADPNLTTKWNDYANAWTPWNHVRTVLTIAASASFVLALRQANAD